MLSQVLKTTGFAFVAFAMFLSQANAGVIFSSTTNQIGTKVDFNKTPQNPAGSGSASKIGLYDFRNDADAYSYLKARIRLWVQLPPEAVGDKAPYIVIAKAGTLDLDLALTVGDAVRLDLRVSYDLFPSGPGVVEKRTDFENITQDQSLAIAAIMEQDPERRIEAWLASEDFKDITVPASFDSLQIVNGRPQIVTTILNSTLDLEAVPEPTSIACFLIAPLTVYSLNRRRQRLAKSI